MKKRMFFKTVAMVAAVALTIPCLAQLQIVDTKPEIVLADDSADNDASIIALLVNTGETETDLNFTWYDNTGEEGTLYFAEYDPSNLDDDGFPKDPEFVIESEQKDKEYTTGGSAAYADYTINRATVSGIKRGVDYVYRVANGDSYSNIYDFCLKGTKDDWNFYYSGDPQLPDSKTIRNQWCSSLDKITELHPDCSFLVTGGDLADGGGANEEQYINGFMLPERMKSMVTATSVGNHDELTSGMPYREHVNQPNQTEINTFRNAPGDYYYTYNNCVFVHLTTSLDFDVECSVSALDEHEEFIRQAFEDNPQCDWHIVVFHEAMYSSSWHSVAAGTRRYRELLVPVLGQIDEDLGIDLVLNAHDHYYSRTYLMQGLTALSERGVEHEFTDPEGVIYITANTGSGIKYYDLSTIDYDYLATRSQEYTPNISNVEIKSENPFESTLQFTTYRTCEGDKYKGNDESMSVVDEFSITKTVDGKKLGDAVKLKDANNGITWDIPNMFVQDEAKLSSNKVVSGDAYNKLKAAVKNDAVLKDYDTYDTVYDVDGTWCDKELELESETGMCIPLPKNVPATFDQVKDVNGNAYFKVYGIGEDGIAKDMNAVLANVNGVPCAQIYAKSAGTYVVSLAGTDKTKTVTVPAPGQNADNTAPAKVAVTKISASKKKITLKAKKKYQIKVKVTPANASNKKLSYKTSNKKVAKVSKTGKITAVKKGNAVITVSTTDGSKKSIKINVKVK